MTKVRLAANKMWSFRLKRSGTEKSNQVISQGLDFSASLHFGRNDLKSNSLKNTDKVILI